MCLANEFWPEFACLPAFGPKSQQGCQTPPSRFNAIKETENCSVEIPQFSGAPRCRTQWREGSLSCWKWLLLPIKVRARLELVVFASANVKFWNGCFFGFYFSRNGCYAREGACKVCFTQCSERNSGLISVPGRVKCFRRNLKV